MPHTINYPTVEIDGLMQTVRQDIYTCEACGERINPNTEPTLVDQSALTLVHPDGYREIVHKANEEGGYFNYYHLRCKAEVPYISQDEQKNIDDAIVRREALSAKQQSSATSTGASAPAAEPQSAPPTA